MLKKETEDKKRTMEEKLEKAKKCRRSFEGKNVERCREEAHWRQRDAAIHCLSAQGELNFYLHDSHQHNIVH